MLEFHSGGAIPAKQSGIPFGKGRLPPGPDCSGVRHDGVLIAQLPPTLHGGRSRSGRSGAEADSTAAAVWAASPLQTGSR
jgi:hypothetical protein